MTAPASAAVSATAFRPRSVSEIADAGIQLVRQHFGPFFMLSTIVAIPSMLLGLLAGRLMPDPAAIAAAGGDPFAAFSNFGQILVLNLVSACWTFVAYGSLVSMADDAYHNRPTEPGTSLGRALRRAGSLIGGNLLAYLLSLGGVFVVGILFAVMVPALAGRGGGLGAGIGVLLFAAGVAAFVWTFYAMGRYLISVTPAVMTEGLGATGAVRRAGLLAAGSVGRILGLVLLLAIVGLFVFIAIFMVVGLGLGSRPQLAGALTTVALIPIIPFAAAMITVMYYDLRIRKEGYDVELMASQLAAPPGELR